MDIHDAVVSVPPSSDISCSVCLDLVSYTGDRSRAKLQCGHEFHLDCIGSAFNIKGAMQCPICHKVEEGQWLYANGSTPSFPSMDNRNLDDDVDGPVHSEMAVRAQWCPFKESTGLNHRPSPGLEAGVRLSSVFPRCPGSSSRAHGLIQASFVFYQQQNPTPLVPGTTRGVTPAVPHLQLDRAGGFHVYPPSSSSGRNLHEADSLYLNNYRLGGHITSSDFGN